jgi:hypothetical protein
MGEASGPPRRRTWTGLAGGVEVVNKVVVTNTSALRDKYGAQFDVREAAAEMVSADERRGLVTRLVALDDAQEMNEFAGEPVTDPTSGEQAKRAIDAVYASLTPEYLVLLGSVDVVPHVELDNPEYAGGDGDPDPIVPSDLPYASEEPASRSIHDFRAPTRVVGRLPDVTGATRPDALAAILGTAATWRSGRRADYESYLGISAEVWSGSTELSLKSTFGFGGGLQRSPTEGPQWAPDVVGRRSHFINCHGAPGSAQFLGQGGPKDYPVAHDAALLTGSVAEGTVTAAECCYGAELYDPDAAGDGMSICMTYLLNGGYGFLGSTTASFGPHDRNDYADLICQYFMRRVLAGASLGRATLEARQEFIRMSPVLDPFDQKTLAQFVLLGDPSIHPVEPMRAAQPLTELLGEASTPPGAALAVGRPERRRGLAAKGVALGAATSFAVPAAEPPSDGIRECFAKLGDVQEISLGDVRSYAVERPALMKAPGAPPGASSSVYVAMTADHPEGAPMAQYRALVSLTENGEITAVKDVRSR